jgi:hypothetical protein
MTTSPVNAGTGITALSRSAPTKIFMRIPDEFKTITWNMCQDLDVIVPQGEDVFPWLLHRTTPADARIVLAFLIDVLGSPPTDDDLLELWSRSRSDMFFFSGAELRAFLTELKLRVAQRMQEPTE